jgi:signal transduction histidine kinase
MNLLTKVRNYRTPFISIITLLLLLVIPHLGNLPSFVSLKSIAAISFLIIVMYTARHGFFSGLMSALVAEIYFLYTYSDPTHPLHYTFENIERLIVIGLTLVSLAYFIGSLRQRFNKDIVIEKNAREKAEKLAQVLKKSDIQKEEFISVASHELRTPITSLRLFTHLLRKKAEKDRDNQTGLYIKKIDNQVNNLITLTTNLLDASRITTGKLTLRKELFSINKLVKEKIDEISGINETHKIIKKGSTTKKILGDKNYLSQVLINLLNNAVRYSPEATKIIVSIEEQEDAVQVSVQDFGPGIAKEYQKKIFEQFYQISGRKSSRGLGIGLYISSQIIKQHGGKISLKSKPKQGATFTVSLPLKVL